MVGHGTSCQCPLSRLHSIIVFFFFFFFFFLLLLFIFNLFLFFC